MIWAWLLWLSLHGGIDLRSDVLHDVWRMPACSPHPETVRSFRAGRFRVEEVYYSSLSSTGKPSRIFGYFCRPAAATGPLPGLLVVHGGGGLAKLDAAMEWAAGGYAVLAIDLPGKGARRDLSRSTGPDMVLANLFHTWPDASLNYLVAAVAAARNGITVLAERPEVDRHRIGMVGGSWGGVITLLTNGQDRRLHAAVDIFGAGYIPEGCTWTTWFLGMSPWERGVWDACLDPSNFLATQHAPLLLMTGTNDNCFYLPTLQKSFESVPVAKTLWLIPNLRHTVTTSMENTALLWLDRELQHRGSWPRVGLLPPQQSPGGRPVMRACAREATRVRFYYAVGGPRHWTALRWEEAPGKRSGIIWTFALPRSVPDPEILCYATGENDLGQAASTEVRSLVALKLHPRGRRTFALSSPIIESNRHDPPLAVAENGKVYRLGIFLSRKEGVYRFLPTLSKTAAPSKTGVGPSQPAGIRVGRSTRPI